MKKSYLLLAAAALTLGLASCSSDESLAEAQKAQDTVVSENDGAISFDAYVNRGTTRAGDAGTLTTASTTTYAVNNYLQKTDGGFGVFSYYTNGENYSDNAKPDFMYNQRVYYSSSSWTYEPLKYWPNEFGQNAESTQQDKLTFFAYAPWVDMNPSTGRLKDISDGKDTYGIVGMTSNTSKGDPYIKYYVSMDPSKRVDLCWGVAKTGFTSTVDGNNNSVDAGSPYIDVLKPKIADKINFDFKHALAALNVQIDADIDDAAHGHGTEVNTRTKIWVRSVTFEGFTDKGMLNLNTKASEGPKWYDMLGTNEIGSAKVSVFDGRRDGREGQTNAEASSETPSNLNTKIVQSEPYLSASYPSLATTGTLPGVTKTAVNLFTEPSTGTDAQKLAEPIFVIPSTDNLKVTIVYDVETYDASLANFLNDGMAHGSNVQNSITKEITIGGSAIKLEAGKVYTIKLHLGLTTVKFDASVTDWGSAAADDTDLPINARSFYLLPVNNSVTNAAGVTVPLTANKMDGTSYDLTGATITYASTSATVNGVKTSPLTSSDVTFSKPNLTIETANSELYNKVYSVQLEYTDGGFTYPSNAITITQAAGALSYTSFAKPSNAATSFSIATNASASPKAYGSGTADWTKAVVKLNYDGEDWTRVETAPVANSKTFQVAANGTVTLGTAVATGKKLTVKIQAGDAAEITAVNENI